MDSIEIRQLYIYIYVCLCLEKRKEKFEISSFPKYEPRSFSKIARYLSRGCTKFISSQYHVTTSNGLSWPILAITQTPRPLKSIKPSNSHISAKNTKRRGHNRQRWNWHLKLPRNRLPLCACTRPYHPRIEHDRAVHDRSGGKLVPG